MKLNPDDSYQHPTKGTCTVGEGETAAKDTLQTRPAQFALPTKLVTIQNKVQAKRLLLSLVGSRKGCGSQDSLVSHSSNHREAQCRLLQCGHAG